LSISVDEEREGDAGEIGAVAEETEELGVGCSSALFCVFGLTVFDRRSAIDVDDGDVDDDDDDNDVDRVRLSGFGFVVGGVVEEVSDLETEAAMSGEADFDLALGEVVGDTTFIGIAETSPLSATPTP